MVWGLGIGAAVIFFGGFALARWFARNAVISATLSRSVDTRAEEQAATEHEHDKAKGEASDVLRASSDDLRRHVDELRARGRAGK